MDAPDLMGSASSSYENLALTYMITTVPTLLSFDAGEAQVVSKVTDARKLADRRFLEQWIINEAKRQGSRGGGGGGGAGGVGASTAIFGGLFGHG
ncbi:Thioredoxin-like protein [Ophiocordyceps sinensis CO18]|nr:Thioredoxin-like protein [Ophiocordyceps sinensis CO18]